MSLFVCSNCQNIENTALCGYWFRGKNPPLCSACDPKIKQWHGHFKQEKYDDVEWQLKNGFVSRL